MILITKIKDSKIINKKLFKLINKIKNSFSNGTTININNTDWSLPKDYKRDYLEYFYTIIKPYMNEIAIKLYSKTWTIHNCWFQQYLKSDHHQWHTHQATNFTNIYFVELPDNSLATEIFKQRKLKIKEGDLITFPGYMYHRSPLNNSKKRKTIISFNSSFGDFYENR